MIPFGTIVREAAAMEAKVGEAVVVAFGEAETNVVVLLTSCNRTRGSYMDTMGISSGNVFIISYHKLYLY